ncbi:hypothetical protein [Mucilaginibacter sp.]
MNTTYLFKEAKAWVKRKHGPDEVVKIIPLTDGAIIAYELYVAYDNPGYLGRILFDSKGYWIYDGDVFTVAEQEQLARFICNYAEAV